MTYVSAIVVAVDFSSYSDAATARAVTLADALDASLHFIHVREASASWDECESDIAEAMDRYVTEAAQRGVYTTTDVMDGDVVPAIKEAIRDHAADLVVVGTRGRSGVKRIFLGSVSERILRELEVPVLVVGEGLEVSGRPITKILCASDFSQPASHALELSMDLAKRLAASLEVVHVVNPAVEVPGPYGVPASEKTLTQHRENIAAGLEQVRQQLKESAIEGSTVVLRGSEEAEIAKRARSGESDLIVVGASSRARITQELQGQLAYQVLHDGPCSVLVANAPKG